MKVLYQWAQRNPTAWQEARSFDVGTDHNSLLLGCSYDKVSDNQMGSCFLSTIDSIRVLARKVFVFESHRRLYGRWIEKQTLFHHSTHNGDRRKHGLLDFYVIHAVLSCGLKLPPDWLHYKYAVFGSPSLNFCNTTHDLWLLIARVFLGLNKLTAWLSVRLFLFVRDALCDIVAVLFEKPPASFRWIYRALPIGLVNHRFVTIIP